VTDVLLRQTNDGGEIVVENGLVLLCDGYETAAYVSLFGGNEDDPGGADTRLQFWGNLIEPDQNAMDRSETQHLLRSIPAVPANLRRIEQAAERDLAWMVQSGVATSVRAEASIPKLHQVALRITIQTTTGTRILEFG
jgi:phage gp46-like protein